MSAFDKLTSDLQIQPAKVVVLRENHWATTFASKPANPIQVGLRQLSVADRELVRQFVSKATIEAVESGADANVAAYTTSLVSTVAAAICHPRDAKREHDLFGCPNDILPIAFTEQTLKWLFDEIEALTVSFSPVFSEATDDEIVSLCANLETGIMARLTETDPCRAARVRRYLDFVITELESLDEP
jgi:hypothetical protein